MVRRRFSKLIDLRHRSGNIIFSILSFQNEWGGGLSAPSETLDLLQRRRQAIQVGGLAKGGGGQKDRVLGRRRQVDLPRGPHIVIRSTRTPASKRQPYLLNRLRSFDSWRRRDRHGGRGRGSHGGRGRGRGRGSNRLRGGRGGRSGRRRVRLWGSGGRGRGGLRLRSWLGSEVMEKQECDGKDENLPKNKNALCKPLLRLGSENRMFENSSRKNEHYGNSGER